MTIKFNCDCGFSWEKGRSGQHNCSPFYRETIDGLKLALKQNDDEIKNSEAVRASIAALVDARTNGLINENNELKAQVNGFINVLSGARKAHLAPHTYYCKVNSILNKSPAQCLQSVKADAVKDAAHRFKVAWPHHHGKFDYLIGLSIGIREGKS